MKDCFLTGFPGFLGSAFAARLLDRDPDVRLTCLVQPRHRAAAEARVRALAADVPARRGRLRLVEGDITRPDLGLGAERAALAPTLREVYHFAAVYDLGVAADLAQRVNVDGTRHVLDLCAAAPELERLHYVSTCYVSGRHAGPFGEDDLDVGQRFNNHYEASKYAAERAVRAAMRGGLPATIYRPSMVVGDSRTGATQKLDGPYGVVAWMLRWPLPGPVPVPVPGDPSRHHSDIVPCDFVIDALDHLSGRADTVGGVYHLNDPDAPTVEEAMHVIAAAAGRRAVRVPVPAAVLSALLRRLPGLARWSGIEPDMVPYFEHPARYTSARTTPLLRAGGLAPPPLAAYADRLVDFVRTHPDLTRRGMT